MPNWIGDFIMAIPVLHDLRNALPQAEITVFAKEHLLSLVSRDPNISRLLPFSEEALKGKEYDTGILLTNSFSSALGMFKAKVRQRIGFTDFLRWPLLTERISIGKLKSEQHHVITYKMLLKPLDIEASDTEPKLFLTHEEIDQARLKVSSNKKVIGINPGAAYGSAKCWPADRFREVAQYLLEKGHEVIFFGDLKTKDLVDTICKDLPVQNFAAKTSLRELMALIYICDVVLTNDSGPMHIASALKVPTVALFGSTDPVQTGPYMHGIVISHKVECAPCFRRTCPIDFRCMKKISTKEVLDKISSV